MLTGVDCSGNRSFEPGVSGGARDWSRFGAAGPRKSAGVGHGLGRRAGILGLDRPFCRVGQLAEKPVQACQQGPRQLDLSEGPGPIWPPLAAVQWVHLGKGAVVGLGQPMIEPLTGYWPPGTPEIATCSWREGCCTGTPRGVNSGFR